MWLHDHGMKSYVFVITTNSLSFLRPAIGSFIFHKMLYVISQNFSRLRRVVKQ